MAAGNAQPLTGLCFVTHKRLHTHACCVCLAPPSLSANNQTGIKAALRQLKTQLPVRLKWVKGHQADKKTGHGLGNHQAHCRAQPRFVKAAIHLPTGTVPVLGDDTDAAAAASALQQLRAVLAQPKQRVPRASSVPGPVHAVTKRSGKKGKKKGKRQPKKKRQTAAQAAALRVQQRSGVAAGTCIAAAGAAAVHPQSAPPAICIDC